MNFLGYFTNERNVKNFCLYLKKTIESSSLSESSNEDLDYFNNILLKEIQFFADIRFPHFIISQAAQAEVELFYSMYIQQQIKITLQHAQTPITQNYALTSSTHSQQQQSLQPQLAGFHESYLKRIQSILNDGDQQYYDLRF